jgi:hypothetical protein
MHAAAPGTVTFAHPADAVDNACRRKIRSRQQIDQFVDRGSGIAQQRETGIHHFAEVVRRNVGRHANRNPRRTVDQQVRNTRRHDQRLFLRAVVVGPEVDRLLVDVGEQLVPDTRHAHFGVTHRGGVVAVDRTEVALPIDQHVAQRKILRHAHNGVVDRRVAVRMVLTDDIADDPRRFLVRLVPVIRQLVHGKQHAPMHRLEAVACVGQRAPDDHAHGIVEIRPTHLVFEADRECFFGESFHLLSAGDATSAGMSSS